MSLNQTAHFNALSDKTRELLEKRVASFGKQVKYRFKIEKKNGDPFKQSGEDDYVFPSTYTLDPTTFDITDTNQDTGSKVKKIGMWLEINDKGIPTKFKKVRVMGYQKGLLEFDMSNLEDVEVVKFLELHPKLEDGLFQDKTKIPVFKRINLLADAEKERAERKAKKMALDAIDEMDDKALLEFSDAMGWDSTSDPQILRNQAEKLAEESFELVNKLMKGKTIPIRAIVKRALDKGVLELDEATGKFKWKGTQQVITVLSPAGEGTWNEKMAEWLQVGGQQADEVLKKVKELISK